MNNKNDKPAIGVFGHYGNENLGDEAIIAAAIDSLKLKQSNLCFYGLSINPADTQKRHKIPSYPIRRIVVKAPQDQHLRTKGEVQKIVAGPTEERKNRHSIKSIVKKTPLLGSMLRATAATARGARAFLQEFNFLIESYKVVKKLDLLMITGSNQFLDNFGGTMGFPYTLLKWSILARIAGVKVALVCVGAGPIYKNSSKLLIRLVLMLANYVSFRDRASQELIRSFGYNGESYVYPDLAHSLKHDIENNCRGRTSGKLAVGINPMPIYDSRYWYVADTSKYDAYVGKLAKFSAWLLKNDYPLFFYATQPKDENVIKDVLAILDGLSDGMADQAKVMYSRDFDAFFKNLAYADIVVTTRFHGALLGLLAEKGVLAVYYHRKTDDLLKEYGQGVCSMVLEDTTEDEMIEKLQGLEQDLVQAKESIRVKNCEYGELLDQQYDKILALID